MIPSQNPVVVDSISESWVKYYQALPAYNYAEKAPEQNLIQLLTRLFSNVLQEILPFWGNPNAWVFYVLIAICIALVIYLLAKYGVINPVQRTGKRFSVYGVGTELQNSIDYDVAIGNAIAQHQYRNAVRLLYLRALADLQEARLINWKPDKTDREYILELTNHETQAPLQESVRIFHNVWYGFADLKPEEIEQVRLPFDNLRSLIRRKV